MAFIPFPSGTVIAFAGSTAPSGWLICNGTAYNQADYPDLYAALASTYNTQINPTTGVAWTAPSASQFRVPDYRGIFLKGVGTPSGGSAVTLGGFQAQKTKPNGLAGTAAAQSLGTTNPAFTPSADSRNIDHTHPQNVGAQYGGYVGGYEDWNRDMVNGSAYAQGVDTFTIGAAAVTHNHTFSSGTTNIAHTHAASSLSLSGDNETRPINIGVNYIIKV